MRILLVEDDHAIADAVEAGLAEAGFAVDAVATVADAELNVTVNEYDCLVLDRMMPDGDTLALVETMRSEEMAVPVLFLTARDAVADRVDGFEVGGDDYLVKPFALEELIVRVRSLCRRRRVTVAPTVAIGDLVIDRARAEVRRDGVLLPLTAKERAILVQLADEVGTVVSRSAIIEHCWDEAHDPMSNVVDVHVAALRRKLGEPSPIRTVRGEGFLLDQGNT